MGDDDVDRDAGESGAAGSGTDDDGSIVIPTFGSFAEIDELERLTIEVAAQAEVERFGPTSEDAHPVVVHEALDRLRSFCSMLPETTEVNPFGHPTFRVATKAYATFELDGGRPSVLFKTEPETQAVLVALEAFASDPDTGHRGWTVVTITDDTDWELLDELIVGSYRLVAPDELRVQLDELLGPT